MILVYSIINKQSFLKIRDYLEKIFEIAKKSEGLNDKKFLKIVLLGNKIDMERHRYYTKSFKKRYVENRLINLNLKSQVSKQELESLLRKYSQKSPQLSTKFTDSTNTITNDQPTSKPTRQTSDIIHVSHYESTSCEEYELVKNLFKQILKEYRREKEGFLARTQGLHSTSSSQPTQLQSSASSSSSSTMSTVQAAGTIPPAPPVPIIDTESIHTPKSKLNNFIRSRGEKHPRGKSPKSSTQVITHDISPANMSIINANLSSPATLSVATSQPLLSSSLPPSSSHLSSSLAHNHVHSSSTSGVSCSPGGSPSNIASFNIGSSSSAIITPNNNSSSSLSRIISSDGITQNTESTSDCGSTPPPSSASGLTTASIKKNSKFPFFTKILNKNN